MRILIVRIDGIGDNVMNTAFVREFYNCYKNKDTTIDLLIRPYVYPVIKNIPYIDNIRFLWDGYLRTENHHVNKLTKALIGYDWVVSPRWGPDIGLVTALVGVNKSIRITGFKSITYDTGIDPYSIFTDCINCTDIIHEVEKPIKLLNYLGYKESSLSIGCFMDKPDDMLVDSILSIFSKKFVCISIASLSNVKRWPIDRYKSLIHYIHNNLNMGVLIVGGEDVIHDGARLIAELGNIKNVVNTVGQISINNMYELMKHSVCIVGNDSGPIHIASCTGNPVISISQFKTNTYDNLLDCWSEPTRHAPYCKNSYTISPKYVNDINTVSTSAVSLCLTKMLNED